MNLTDRTFWLKYWENKEDLNINIPENYILSANLKEIQKSHPFKNAIELGGFPGYYSIYLKKWLNVDATLLDYVIHPTIIDDVFKKNNLTKKDISLIEADIFNFKPNELYDLVMSVGVIEHFDDTNKIIKQHLKFMSEKGVLFINIPNFRGFNGWLQKTFDPENYSKHNINCMDLDFLKKICQDLGLKGITVEYYGGFMMWLENLETKSIFFKAAFKSTWFILKVISKLIPVESKAFSPYINITAYK